MEATSSISSDTIYTFTIDGVRFEDFQRKPAQLDIRPEQDEQVITSPKVNYVAPAPSKPQPQATTLKPKMNLFPSVEDESTKKFDPFASNSGSSTNTFSSDPFSSGSTTLKPKQQEVDFFATSAPAAKTSNNIDFFAAPAPSSTTASKDPFALPPAPATNKNTNPDFFSTPATQPKDNFGSNDFFSAPVSASSAKPSGGLNDFHGLTFDVAPTPMLNNSTTKNNNVMSNEQTAPNSNAQETPVPGDPWGGLVDLNLGAKEKPQQRRTSIQGTGPTLNQMTNNQPQAKAMQSTATPAFGVTHMGGGNSFGGGLGPAPSPALGNNNSYAASNPFGPSSMPSSTSPYGASPNPMGMGYNATPLSPMGAPMGGAMMGGNPYGAAGAGNPYGGANVNPFNSASGGYTQQGPPKTSSLDSLNWKM